MEKKNNVKTQKNKSTSKNKRRYIVVAFVFILLVATILYFMHVMKTKDVYSSLPQGDPLDPTYNKSYQVDPEDENRMLNTSDQLTSKKEYQGLAISNVKISQYGEMAEVTGDITNISGKEIEGPLTFYLVLTDKQGNQVKMLKSMVKNLAAGATTSLLIEKKAPLANAYDYHVISEEEYNNIINSITADEEPDE